MKIEFDWPDNMPIQYSRPFIQGMLNRMAMSFTKYGHVHLAYPHKVNAMATHNLKLAEYEKDENTEKLIDAANYLMIEFMFPFNSTAKYKPTDGSSGRIFHGEVNPVLDKNTPEYEK